ncbi:MAG TPA: site-specific integrase [bacterium]
MRSYRRNGAWYIDYVSNGKRVRMKVGSSKYLADLALKDIEVKKVKGKFLGIADVQNVIFDKLCDDYLQFSRANKAYRSYRRDLSSLKQMLRTFGGKPVAAITAYEFEQYKNLRRQDVSPASVNREISCVKHMFNKAVQWGYLNNNPLRLVMKFKEPPGRVRYLNEEEINRLIAACNGHVRSMVIMALNTGMRRGEILNLKWGDVDLRNRVIVCRRTKNNETRMIPVNDVLYAEIRAMGPQMAEQYVFCNEDGKPFTTIQTGFEAAMRRAGIKDFRFHDLRHVFGSRLVMAGVDIRSVQELLGHKDIKMTMRYSHLSNAHLREAVKRLENGTGMAPDSLEEIAGSKKLDISCCARSSTG